MSSAAHEVGRVDSPDFDNFAVNGSAVHSAHIPNPERHFFKTRFSDTVIQGTLSAEAARCVALGRSWTGDCFGGNRLQSDSAKSMLCTDLADELVVFWGSLEATLSTLMIPCRATATLKQWRIWPGQPSGKTKTSKEWWSK